MHDGVEILLVVILACELGERLQDLHLHQACISAGKTGPMRSKSPVNACWVSS